MTTLTPPLGHFAQYYQICSKFRNLYESAFDLEEAGFYPWPMFKKSAKFTYYNVIYIIINVRGVHGYTDEGGELKKSEKVYLRKL